MGLLKSNPKLAAREIGDALWISPRTVEKHLAKLREEGIIRRIGPDKGGHWEVVE
jgi:DNA-binding Lrp family transcriptional regulator